MDSKAGSYHIIGEEHLSEVLNSYATSFDGVGKQPGDYFDALVSRFMCFLYELDCIKRTEPKHVFMEGTGKRGNHIPNAVRMLIKEALEPWDGALHAPDIGHPEYEFMRDDNNYQTEREKRWANLITLEKSGLVIVGRWHTRRLRRKIIGWNPFTNVYAVSTSSWKTPKNPQIASTHIELLENILEHIPADRYEHGALRRAIEGGLRRYVSA